MPWYCWYHQKVGKLKGKNKSHTSRPARVSKTVPRPPAVTHFWVEKPSNSINNEKAAIHTAEYTALPANWNPIWKMKTSHKIIDIKPKLVILRENTLTSRIWQTLPLKNSVQVTSHQSPTNDIFINPWLYSHINIFFSFQFYLLLL